MVILLRAPESRRLAYWEVVPPVIFLPTHARIPAENDHGHPPFFYERRCIELEARVWDWCILRARTKFRVFNLTAMPDTHEVTLLLAEWAKGNQRALDDLTPLVYRELRQLAAGYLRKERQGHTLQPTALVHEAYVRLVDQTNPTWQSRSHFFGVAARLMRQILVDHARRKHAGKRAGIKLPLNDAVSFREERSRDLVALDSGLTELEKIDPRKCKAVELRYFGGLSMDEIAQALDVSEITVRRDLRMAEAWLRQEMKNE
jgi:RNA polymerase sigma-70 factor (ECF subfamily)